MGNSSARPRSARARHPGGKTAAPETLVAAAPTDSVARQRRRLYRHSTHTGGATPSTIRIKAP